MTRGKSRKSRRSRSITTIKKGRKNKKIRGAGRVITIGRSQTYQTHSQTN